MEGEDRNADFAARSPPSVLSPSVWRARIETARLSATAECITASPSVWRARIETPLSCGACAAAAVALRMEGEDRNSSPPALSAPPPTSPSVWRARIETSVSGVITSPSRSPSVWRARIETLPPMPMTRFCLVALRMEGEDRNRHKIAPKCPFSCRPPYGGRG